MLDGLLQGSRPMAITSLMVYVTMLLTIVVLGHYLLFYVLFILSFLLLAFNVRELGSLRQLERKSLLDMELSLRLASLRAGIGKWPNTGVFRRMKVWDYRVADVGPGVVAGAIGRTREFGWRREVGLVEGLREAKRVLKMGGEDDRSFIGRFKDWLVG